MPHRPFAVVILAAGLGKRMKSNLPKVLHELAGLPLLLHILERVREAAPGAEVAIVVGHGKDEVESRVRSYEGFSDLKITFVEQPEPLGTGHAVRCVMEHAWGAERVRTGAPILVLPGDLPLIQGQLIRELLAPLKGGAAIRLATTELQDPTGYGRVLRRGTRGPVLKIVEEKDASPKQKLIREVAVSIYTFEPRFLKSGIARINTKNAQKEYYLTDLVSLAVRAKKKIEVLPWEASTDFRGINNLWELAEAGHLFNQRLLKHWAVEGVRFEDPSSTWIDARVTLAEGVRVGPGVLLQGRTHVARDARIGPGCVLKDVTVGEGAEIKVGSVAEDSSIGAHAKVGPYAHLRPQSFVGDEAKIGNFVELKKTRVGKNTSVAHLSYLGDAEVGERVNIGCGFVTCNFDGRVVQGQRKHKTVIEDDVFVGSDCQTVAPVRLRKGSYVASGSTITEDVESGDLAIARARQVNKSGYARRIREK